MKKLTMICILLMAPFAQAQKEDYVIQEDNREMIQANSSAANRVDQQFMLTGILTGIGPSFTSTTGLQGGYYLDRNKLVLIEVTSGVLGLKSSLSSDESGSDYVITSKSIGVHYKQFAGNSFYFNAGADYRTLKYDYTFRFFGDPEDTRKFEGSSLAATFYIGNQWQWDNFTLGCDWIGYALPITSQISNEEVVSQDPDYDQERLDSDAKLLVKSGHFTLLRFYLGASF